MRANELRHRITVQSRKQSDDALGQQVMTWVNFSTVSAKIEQLSGRELMTANAERAENLACITIRYTPGIIEKMRILYGDIIYDITSVSDIDGRKKELQLMVKTGVSNG